MNQDRQCGQATLRMVGWSRAAEFPNLRRENQSLQFVTVRPPAIPQFAHVMPRRLFVSREIGRFQKTGETEKNRFGVAQIFAQVLERESLRDQRERKFVLFVTDRRRDFLEKRFVGAVVRAGLAVVDPGPKSRRFFPETELRGGI